MNILITGATGYVAKALVKELVKLNYNLFLLVRNTIKCARIYESLKNQIQIVDLNNFNWKSEIKNINPKVVIHLASHLTSSYEEDNINHIIESNISFPVHLLDSLRGTSLQYFINTGSFSEYKMNDNILSPSYLYSASKSGFRSFLQFYQSLIGFKTINLIPYTIYGGEDSQKKLIDIIYSSFDAEIPIKMSPGNQVLDFIHITDVVNFYISLVKKIDRVVNTYNEYHVGSGIGTSPRQLASLLEDISNKNANIIWGGVPYRINDTMYAVAKNEMNLDFIEWKPLVKLSDGLKMYLEFKKQQNDGL